MEKPQKKKAKEGRKSVFSEALGLGVMNSYRFPRPIHALLKIKKVKKLLNWMAMDKHFMADILKRVPEEKPLETEVEDY